MTQKRNVSLIETAYLVAYYKIGLYCCFEMWTFIEVKVLSELININY